MGLSLTHAHIILFEVRVAAYRYKHIRHVVIIKFALGIAPDYRHMVGFIRVAYLCSAGRHVRGDNKSAVGVAVNRVVVDFVQQ